MMNMSVPSFNRCAWVKVKTKYVKKYVRPLLEPPRMGQGQMRSVNKYAYFFFVFLKKQIPLLQSLRMGQGQMRSVNEYAY